MQQIWPARGLLEDDALGAHLRAERTAPTDRPWITASMISSIDGAASADGRSGELGGDGDRAVFHALRKMPQAILVGAQTVRAERYRTPKPNPETGSPPRLIIVSTSLNFPDDVPALSGNDTPAPIVVTSEDAPLEAVKRLAGRAEVWRIGATEVDFVVLWRRLMREGIHHAVCEGGPSLLGELLVNEFIDEWYFTLSPTTFAGDAGRIAHTDTAKRADWRLTSALVAGSGELLCRYVRSTNFGPTELS